MHVARLQGLLTGDTPRDRFGSFIRRLRKPDVVRALFHEYPVLARQLIQAIDQRVRFGLEFLRHMAEDWPALRAGFADGGDLGHLVHVGWNAGDQHRSGRSVLIVRFSSGLRLVYKPKSLAVEVNFQRLLAWFNESGAEVHFRLLNVLDRGDHGWVEYVEAGPCRTPAQVRRFYHRQGAYLALLHVLAATDFHYENVIAAGEHPVLVDLEALFHGSLSESESDPVRRGLRQGVLDVGLLPRLHFAGESTRPIDLSGLGAPSGQYSPYGVSTWIHTGSDDMCMTRQQGIMPPGKNRPTLGGVDVDLRGYAADLEAGFTSLYRMMAARREELAGRLASFGDQEVRFIARPTKAYAVLLNLGWHPDRLRDGLERDRCFDRLSVHALKYPCLERLIDAERADLHQGDIPMFRTRPASRDLWTSRDERIVDFFDHAGMDLAQNRLAGLDEGGLVRECWVIRASLGLEATFNMTEEPGTGEEGDLAASRSSSGLTREQLLAAAQVLGDRLLARAWQGGGEAGWAGLIPDDPRGWTMGPVGLDLRAGLPGVVLFLACLGKATGEVRYTALARAGLVGLRRRLADEPPADGHILGGLVYLLTQLGRLWDEPDRLIEAVELAQHLPAPERDGPDDVAGLHALRHLRPAEPRRSLEGVELPGLDGGLSGAGLTRLLLADPDLRP